MAKVTDINGKDPKWIDIGEKLLTPEMKAKLLDKMNDDKIKKPQHYHGKTLELIDVIKDFFGNRDAVIWCCLNIIKYAFRLEKKDTALVNLKKIKKYSEMAIEISESEEPLILKDEVKE